MNVRLATAADIPALVEMGARFHAFSADPVPYCRDSAALSAQGLLQMGFALIAERDGEAVGMIGVAVVPLFFNARTQLAQELMWWVADDARGTGAALALLRAAEDEARARGAGRLQMIALANSPDHVALIYTRLGFRHCETAYVKEL